MWNLKNKEEETLRVLLSRWEKVHIRAPWGPFYSETIWHSYGISILLSKARGRLVAPRRTKLGGYRQS